VMKINSMVVLCKITQSTDQSPYHLDLRRIDILQCRLLGLVLV